MFWSHEKIEEPVESIGQYLREELRLRLRVAADFATLGAYELSELDEEADRKVVEAEEPAPEVPGKAAAKAAGKPAVERIAPEAPPKRVLLFAKVAPVCPHSAVRVEPPCATDHAKRSGAERRSASRRTQRQRGGSVRAPEQSCVCAAERAPGV